MCCTRGELPRAPYSKELLVQIKKMSPRMVRFALTLSALCSITAASSLLSQQAQVPALAAPAAPAPATTPAPRASTLYAQDETNAPTIANARADNAAALSEGGSHTIVVSTLVLVLAVVILVLLIA
jgi:hypothetical protein